MSIASEITRLQGCKSDIRTALVNKGVTSASTHNMADFATDISNISAGGATITVTYDSSFYNKTMTCSNGTKTYTKTTTSSGSTTFNVSEEGTWTITCNGVSVTVAVVLSYSTQMKPTGSTATPVNDIQTWLKCGGIFNKTYTTINQVLADTTTLLALISDSNAVDYMVRSTTWASSVCANSTAMTDIGANNYCATTLLANSTWCTAICNSTYIDSVLNKKVPTMTSANAPSGEVSRSSANSRYPAYYAFDGNNNTNWGSTIASESWIQYMFTSAMVCKYVTVYDSGHVNQNITIKGSNDGTNFTNLATDTLIKQVELKKTLPSNTTAYKYYRIVMNPVVSNENSGANIIQFYGR